MQKEFEDICQLLTNNNQDNAKVALQILKGSPELTKKVKEYFQPILEASNKKTLKALPNILEQLKQGKGTMKARLKIGTVPEIHPSVKFLFLNNQKLERLPKWISNLTNLETLALSDCHLNSLPNWIGNLTKLKFLSIAGNQIQKLPNSIGNLEKLECCYIIENQIKELPKSITNLARLKNFYVKKGNPITKKEILEVKKLMPKTTFH